MLLKKDVYNAKIKDIDDKIPDITNLLLFLPTTNTTLNAKTNEVKKIIPSITNLATTAALNVKINEVKGEIPNTTNLTTTTALTAVENKIINLINKKTDYNTNISETENKNTTDHDHDHDKYITTQEFNKLTAENFTARLKQANVASKTEIAKIVKETDLDNKFKNVTSNKNELYELSEKLKQYQQKN